MGQVQNSFLDALQIPRISEWISTDLGAAIPMGEIFIAIALSLFDMFSDSFEKGILSASLRGGQITQLPKPAKTYNKCDNLRPISLLNVDLEILV